jgi:hypothetical protein
MLSAGSVTTEIPINPLKFKIVVLGPQLFCFKREYPEKLVHREISPYHILTLPKKVGEF